MSILSTNPLWVEKYRPKTVAETILPDEIKKTFQTFVDNREIPNLLLCGSAGTGKTTIARAMLEELGCDYIVVNGSLNGNIDTLRNEIQNFASSRSVISEGRKYVILDEADYLTHHVQPALRNFMEEFSKNCGFIFTCNYRNKIIDPLQSRCSVIEFRIPSKDKPKVAVEFLKRIENILTTENVPYEKPVIAEVISKYFPDWRRVLNELQRYATSGAIDTGILRNFENTSIKELVGYMKDKNFTEVRKWVKANLDSDVHILFNSFYEGANGYFTPRTIPLLVMILAKYQYQASFAANQEINFVAFLAECMVELEYV